MATGFTTSANSTVLSSSNFKQYLKSHYKNSEDKKSTNTRIKYEKLNITGGTYSIPDDEYFTTFLPLYCRDVYKKKQPEYLTEAQMDTNGPIVIDLDFRYDYDVKERQHTKEHIMEIVDIHLEELKKIYQFDDSEEFFVFIMEKPNVKREADKKRTKDGIHILIGIDSDTTTRIILRDKVLKKIHEKEELSSLPLTNKWDEIYDERISIGVNNWQLFGSCKPGFETYGLTYIYKIKFDDSDNEFCIEPIQPQFFDVGKNIKRLSVRNKENPSFFMKNDFLILHNEYRQLRNGNGKVKSKPINTSLNSSFDDSDNMLVNLRKITNASELEYLLNAFLESLNKLDFKTKEELKEAYDYTMALPDTYYNYGCYTKWISVCWALKNTSDKLIIVWIAFSAQAKNFNYVSGIQECFDKWFETTKRKDGYTLTSIRNWCKTDAYKKYVEIRENTLDHLIEMTIDGDNMGSKKDKKTGCAGDVQIANILLYMFKDTNICGSIGANKWYYFVNNRWIQDDKGTTLRTRGIAKLRELYIKKSIDTVAKITFLNASESNDENQGKDEKKRTFRLSKIMEISDKLSNASSKNSIMTEAIHLFYDKDFMNKLDEHKHLLCFNNGVFDFREKVFRKGKPDDYISLSTNIDYIPLDNKRDSTTIEEINDFMNKLFVDVELRTYMWDHLASSLTGFANQTFNYYLGRGANGKSKLTKIMGLILGEYKGDCATTLITGEKVKIGGTSTELVELKGKRYVVMPEPKKGEKMNEGMMKLLTSGDDIITCRALYSQDSLKYYPQMSLVCCANTQMVVESNDDGTWRRIRVVPFKSKFVRNIVVNDSQNPHQFLIDDDLDYKVETWPEVFMAMLIKHYCETDGKIKDCGIVLSESNKYRAKEDRISEFINERVILEENGKIRKTDLNNEFKLWFESTYGRGNKGPTAKEIQEYMVRVHGEPRNNVWTGVTFNTYHNTDEPMDNIDDDISSEDL